MGGKEGTALKISVKHVKNMKLELKGISEKLVNILEFRS